MKTNKIMNEIRGTIPPALKMQMELSVAKANRIYDILEEKDEKAQDLQKGKRLLELPVLELRKV